MEPTDIARARELVEKLEALVQDAKAVPLTNQVRIDQDAALFLIAELRSALN